jgi:hypothetical protein
MCEEKRKEEEREEWLQRIAALLSYAAMCEQ